MGKLTVDYTRSEEEDEDEPMSDSDVQDEVFDAIEDALGGLSSLETFTISRVTE